MITIRPEQPADVAAREALLDLAYGPVRFTKPSQRLREQREPALSFVALEQGRVIGTVRAGGADLRLRRRAVREGALHAPGQPGDRRPRAD